MRNQADSGGRGVRQVPGAARALAQISPGKPGDAEVLTEIAFAAKRLWGYAERWIESWRDLLTITPEFIVSHETHVAKVDGRIVGFYALEQKQNRLNLMHMWVLPDRARQGVGRFLFHHAIERAKVLDFRELEIESDPNAEGFYLRLGARRVGVSVKELFGQRRELPLLIYDAIPGDFES
jgi:GNAT superfamily N-acetyltransferase